MTEIDPNPTLPAPARWHQRRGPRVWIALLAIVLFFGWKAGTFDHALVNVGLNAKPCARNGFGATFCGQELEERQAAQRQAKQESEAAQVKASEAEQNATEKLAHLERQSQEAANTARVEGEEAQRAIERSGTP